MEKKSDQQVPARRRFLQKTLSLIPLAAAGGSSVIAFTTPAAEATSQGVSSQYVPTFFNNDEWRFILAACDRLIPTDSNGPGAVSEGVPVYIDKQMELPYGYGHLWYMHPPFASAVAELGYQSSLVPRETYRQGIRAINQHCQQQFQKIFADLSSEQQETILHDLEGGKLTFENVPGKLFFEQLLENTKEGYLADPMHGGNQTLASWKMIGFPGARADFQDQMDRPNQPYPLGPVSISGKRSV
ncbi:gluconate 2-dehydrogenase subunit 3 family protein [Erwinia sp. MMLR14_017]|uniref:gluconate 2-dehydrogenase subunit 3 family protein n=1 Tax=Erwinia sp. MMLR14_017 TaxID=3093842 RepID=UPI002990765C|nr:gluconate 2-dehydrogenase subunit 3 family protein [Erwinia sp. MMLR14_017]MDW8845480.1 gluconate 2-dehydrogenase subunit 3 family protein [Erwinia sp. MMLR14_017]